MLTCWVLACAISIGELKRETSCDDGASHVGAAALAPFRSAQVSLDGTFVVVLQFEGNLGGVMVLSPVERAKRASLRGVLDFEMPLRGYTSSRHFVT